MVVKIPVIPSYLPLSTITLPILLPLAYHMLVADSKKAAPEALLRCGPSRTRKGAGFDSMQETTTNDIGGPTGGQEEKEPQKNERIFLRNDHALVRGRTPRLVLA